MLKGAMFLAASLVLLYVSRASLRAHGSHGFYRFFAWEVMLALFLLNVDVWFTNPFSWHQIISWFLLCVCIVPLVLGVHGLRSGRPLLPNAAGEPQLLAFEKTTALVTTGIYRYIRHPLYSSLFLLAWGVSFKNPTGWSILLALAATALLIATARADEAECLRFFGREYTDYMKRTKMFVPFLF